MSIYHKIFVNKSFDENNIHLLSKHMYINDFLQNVEQKAEIIETPIMENKSENMINRKDPLFWCLYISVYGYDEYILLKHSIDNTIINEKQKVGSYFVKNPNFMKNVNIKMTKKDIQMLTSQIMVNEEVSIQLLYAFSIFYKRPIIVTNNKSYLKIIPDDHNEDYIIILKTNDGYGFDDKLDYEYIVSNYFELYKYDEPLMPISKYKISELKALMETTNIELSNNDKKTMYYEISRYYNWEKN